MSVHDIHNEAYDKGYKVGVEEGIKRCFDILQSTIANSDNDHLNEIRGDIAEDLLEYAPTFLTRWKEIQELQQLYQQRLETQKLNTRMEVIRELMVSQIMNDQILPVAHKLMKQTNSCCNVEMKTCSKDVWEGDIAAFARQVAKLWIPKE